jgi:hypothetical protein
VRPEPVVGDREARSNVRPKGDPEERKRCHKAADGDQDDWLDYCNTVPPRLRTSCRNIASDNSQVKRGWCDLYWGPGVTCEQ